MTFLAVLGLAALAQAQTFTTLYNFDSTNGVFPYAGVIQDPSGNLYGTAELGGDWDCNYPDGCGVVYKVTTAGEETVLHSFTGYPSDGSNSYAPLVRDSSGNIYGTTEGGAASIFKINTAGNETVYSDGDYAQPFQGLVMDKAGNLYGTFTSGPALPGGVFKLDSAGNITILYQFSSYLYPTYGHLTIDKSGNLYGVSENGGANNGGVLYELTQSGTFTVLRNFGSGTDGSQPYGSVVQDKKGNLYGTTLKGGAYGYGTIWKISKAGAEHILHSFSGGTSDGCNPYAGVTLDQAGNFYGVTYLCGANNYGALYELSAKGKLTLLHSFSGSDGASPIGEVLRTTKGTLYGTTYQGGISSSCGGPGCGTLWSYVP